MRKIMEAVDAGDKSFVAEDTADYRYNRVKRWEDIAEILYDELVVTYSIDLPEDTWDDVKEEIKRAVEIAYNRGKES